MFCISAAIVTRYNIIPLIRRKQHLSYDRDEGFDYLQEQAILSEFKTSTTTSIGKTTHIHRPLEYYLNNLISNHFSITDFSELWPTGFISTNYEYIYPRFLGVTAQRISE